VTGWLLDTNVLSELRRPKPEPKVVGFIASKPLDLLFVSTVTFAEIRFGIERIADATRRAELNDWLARSEGLPCVPVPAAPTRRGGRYRGIPAVRAAGRQRSGRSRF